MGGFVRLFGWKTYLVPGWLDWLVRVASRVDAGSMGVRLGGGAKLVQTWLAEFVGLLGGFMWATQGWKLS